MTTKYPVPILWLIRDLSSLVLLVVFIYPKLWQTQRTAMVVLRGAVLSVATLTMGLSLR
ncbi:MAG: hypothetical protein HWE20_12620 [Gammaproteobacteria bacterium]|nr:hypothetical protein [Gammaproteobacteria bacterium]